ncbi:hypothetical protein ACW9UR_01570 [Halovulum sp. GXIMD14794]
MTDTDRTDPRPNDSRTERPATPRDRQTAAQRYLDLWERHLSLLATSGTRHPSGGA